MLRSFVFRNERNEILSVIITSNQEIIIFLERAIQNGINPSGFIPELRDAIVIVSPNVIPSLETPVVVFVDAEGKKTSLTFSETRALFFALKDFFEPSQKQM